MAKSGEVELLPCFFQGMTVVIADSLEGITWEGICFGAVEELGYYRYLVVPVGSTLPMLICPDVHMWPAKKQHKFCDHDIENVTKIFPLSARTEEPEPR